MSSFKKIPENYYGFVYQWENIKNGKKYIGSHCGKIDDSYIGSGIEFWPEYKKNPKIFRRTILEYVHGNRKKLLKTEQKYLNKVTDIINNRLYYNISAKACGGSNHDHLSIEYKLKMYNHISNCMKDFWSDMSGAEKNQLFKEQQQSRDNKTNEEKNIINSKRSETLRNKSNEEKTSIRKKKQKSWTKEKREKHSKQTKKRRLLEEKSKTSKERKKHAEATKNGHKKSKELNPEKWEKLSKLRSINAKLQHKKEYKYINKLEMNKMVPKAELKKWFKQGWVLGRI